MSGGVGVRACGRRVGLALRARRVGADEDGFVVDWVPTRTRERQQPVVGAISDAPAAAVEAPRARKLRPIA